MTLGFGTVAYFDIHFQLAIIFGILIIFALPSMLLFRYYGNGNRNDYGFMHSVMLGNLGFSSIYCHDTNFAANNLNLVCPSGKIGRIESFGVIPSDAAILDACSHNNDTIQCKNVYNEPYVRNELELNCLGRVSCNIHPNNFIDRSRGLDI